MDDFVSLTCPNCGGKLQVSTTIDRFACIYCGNEYIVNRGEGIIFLQPVVEGLKKVHSGVDKTASELAIQRLSEEIATLEITKSEEKGVWLGSNYGWGGAFIFMLAAVTFFSCVVNPNSAAPYICLALTAVVAFSVLRILNKQKKVEEKKWKNWDVLISSKKEELFFHQDIVSRY